MHFRRSERRLTGQARGRRERLRARPNHAKAVLKDPKLWRRKLLADPDGGLVALSTRCRSRHRATRSSLQVRQRTGSRVPESAGACFTDLFTGQAVRVAGVVQKLRRWTPRPGSGPSRTSHEAINEIRAGLDLVDGGCSQIGRSIADEAQDIPGKGGECMIQTTAERLYAWLLERIEVWSSPGNRRSRRTSNGWAVSRKHAKGAAQVG